MKTFIEHMNEIEKNLLSIEWDRSGLLGEFVNHGVRFRITFKAYGDDVYGVKFKRQDSKGAWKTSLFNDNHYVGNVVKTISDTVRYFMLEKDTSVMLFMGRQSDKGRIRMYDKFTKMMERTHGYNSMVFPEPGMTVYCLHTFDDIKALSAVIEGIDLGID